MVMTTCPECYAEVTVYENPTIGGLTVCESCGEKLEIVWLYPLSLDLVEYHETETHAAKPGHSSVEVDHV